LLRAKFRDNAANALPDGDVDELLSLFQNTTRLDALPLDELMQRFRPGMS
jgi:hypothetical protein